MLDEIIKLLSFLLVSSLNNQYRYLWKWVFGFVSRTEGILGGVKIPLDPSNQPQLVAVSDFAWLRLKLKCVIWRDWSQSLSASLSVHPFAHHCCVTSVSLFLLLVVPSVCCSLWLFVSHLVARVFSVLWWKKNETSSSSSYRQEPKLLDSQFDERFEQRYFPDKKIVFVEIDREKFLCCFWAPVVWARRQSCEVIVFSCDN